MPPTNDSGGKYYVVFVNAPGGGPVKSVKADSRSLLDIWVSEVMPRPHDHRASWPLHLSPVYPERSACVRRTKPNDPAFI